MGRLEDTRTCLAEARRVAKRYNAHKVLTRIIIAESEVLAEHDRERAIESLEEGREIASAYRLRIQLNEINYRLAKLALDSARVQFEPSQLIEENRRISVDLVDEVRQALLSVLRPSTAMPEFALLSRRTRQIFRSTLLADYEAAVTRLNRDITEAGALLQ